MHSLKVLGMVTAMLLFIGCGGPVGPQGEAGEDGVAGPQGEAGKDGVAGPQGEAGVVGLEGQVCPSGSAIAGFSVSGSIICVHVVIATPTPISGLPPTAQSSGGDSQRPTLEALSILPSTVAVGSSAQTILVTLAASDNLSWVDSINVSVTTAMDTNNVSGRAALVSGTNLDGLYSVSLTIPQFAPTGVWVIREISVSDNAGNRVIYLDESIFPGSNVDGISRHHVQELGADSTFIVL